MPISVKITFDVPPPTTVAHFLDQLEKDLIPLQTSIYRDFLSTTASWRVRPGFFRSFDRAGKKLTLSVYTISERYGRVCRGTKAHQVPRRKNLLTARGTRRKMAFQPHYRRKTTPGQLGSRAGFHTGPRIVRTGPWIVGGIEAGDFDTIILGKHLVQAVQIAQTALLRLTQELTGQRKVPVWTGRGAGWTGRAAGWRWGARGGQR